MQLVCFCRVLFCMIRRPPRSTRTDPLFPTRRSSDLLPLDTETCALLDRTRIHINDARAFTGDVSQPPREKAAATPDVDDDLVSAIDVDQRAKITYLIFDELVMVERSDLFGGQLRRWIHDRQRIV